MGQKEEILKIFPRELRTLLGQVAGNFHNVQEIRLRTGQPLMMIMGDKEYLVRKDGGLEPGDRPPGQERDGSAHKKTGWVREHFYLVNQEQMKETVEYMGSFSLYAAEEELRQGFLTIQGGHRIGVAGKTLAQGQDIRLMKFISFINVRVAHEILGCADEIIDYLYSEDKRTFLNTLIISPPRCGKTTLLRDVIRQVSYGRQLSLAETGMERCKWGQWIPGMSVGVVDERSELGACYQGVPQNDLGPRTDVLDCCPKGQGMMMLVRTMAPRVIAVDEIGGRGDVEAVEYVKNCGCSLAATVHGSSLEDLRQKPALKELLEQGAFERLILLSRERGAGHVACIWDGSGSVIMKKRCC